MLWSNTFFLIYRIFGLEIFENLTVVIFRNLIFFNLIYFSFALNDFVADENINKDEILVIKIFWNILSVVIPAKSSFLLRQSGQIF